MFVRNSGKFRRLNHCSLERIIPGKMNTLGQIIPLITKMQKGYIGTFSCSTVIKKKRRKLYYTCFLCILAFSPMEIILELN
jgi:hypothetical protein